MFDTRCLCIEVRSAAQNLTRLYDQALVPTGITITQLSQLNTIRELSDPTLSQLAKATGLNRSTLGRNIRLLESMDLISIQTGQDARTKSIRLTPQGKLAMKRAVPIWAEIQAGLQQQLGDKKRELLHELMAELAAPNLLKATS